MMNQNEAAFKKHLKKLMDKYSYLKYCCIAENSFKTRKQETGKTARFNRVTNVGYPKTFNELANSPALNAAFRMRLGVSKYEDIEFEEFLTPNLQDDRCARILQHVRTQMKDPELKTIPPLKKLRTAHGVHILYLPSKWDPSKSLSRQSSMALNQACRDIKKIKAISVGGDIDIIQELTTMTDTLFDLSEEKTIGSSDDDKKTILIRNAMMERARRAITKIIRQLQIDLNSVC